MRLGLEHQEAGALADRHPAALLIERTARRRIEKLQRVEAHEADAGDRVDTAGDRDVDHTVGDQLGRLRERDRARAARRDDRVPRTAEAQAARQRFGVRGGQHGAYRADGGRPRALARAAPVPRLGLQHAAADGADDERRRAAIARPEARIREGLGGGGDGQTVGARAARRARRRSGDLRADPAAEALGLDQREVADRADAGGEPLPVRDEPRAVWTDGAEAGDDDRLHAEGSFPAMNRDSVSKEAKCSERSWFSSRAMPKRSSIAIDSSMKSRESRPIEPSMPLGSGVDSVVSAARRGSNFRRDTRTVFSSSRTSLASMTLLCCDRDLRAPAAPAPGDARDRHSGGTRERQLHERRTRERLTRPARDQRLERRGGAGTVSY